MNRRITTARSAVLALTVAATAASPRPLPDAEPPTSIGQEAAAVDPQSIQPAQNAGPPSIPAMADNPSAPKPWQAIPLPALQSDPPETVRADSCAITLTGDHVSMEVSVTPTGDTPALLLEGSRFGWAGPAARYPNGHFPELQIRIDGVPRPPQDRYAVFVGNRNITTMLRLTGMDPLAVTRTPPSTVVDAHGAPQLMALANVGAIEKSSDGYLAKWQVQRIVRIALEPRSPQRVTLEYQARPAVSVVSLEELDSASREKSYCLSAARLRRLPHVRPGYGWQATEYVLPTGIDHRAVKPVTLTLASSAGADAVPRDYAFICGSHGKPMSARGGVIRGIADVDELGNLHVLRVAEARPAQ